MRGRRRRRRRRRRRGLRGGEKEGLSVGEASQTQLLYMYVHI